MLEMERFSGKPPRRTWRIPGSEALEMLMRARCLVVSLLDAECLLLALSWAMMPWRAAAVATLLAALAIWLTVRLDDINRDVCVKVPADESDPLDLWKISEAARLRFVTPFRIAALLIGLAWFSAAVLFEATLAPNAGWQATVIYMGFLGIWPCISLFLGGGWVINPDHRSAQRSAA
ncbi:MAG TPA: hypothetical protein VHA35_22055 [Dongiaceae bacterium]|nr:hypothetical protein [Dongiaceae bacterium]